MFQGFNSDLLSFYADIRFHNEKAFMDAHRQEYYQKVRDPFYAFIAEMAPVMLSIDPDMEVRPAKCLSRINRDTRYSRDKSPYRDHHWVAFRRAAAGKDGMPFYWFEIRLDAVNWGLGVWGENRPMMDGLRRRMAANPDEMIGLLRLLQKRDFSVGGTQWKKLRPPEDLPAVLQPLYCMREIYFSREHIDPGWIFDASITDRVAADFQAIAPVWRLLRGLSDIGEETYD